MPMSDSNMFKTSYFRFVLLILCFVMMGFSHHPYKKSYKIWTRSDEVYQREDFHASFKWHATQLSDAFLEAWASEYAKIYDLSAEQNQSFLNDLQKKYTDFDVFFVVFYSYNHQESDLSKNNSIWQLNLASEFEKRSPVKIEKLSKPSSYDKHIFRDLDTWSTGYFVYFPKSTHTPDQTHPLQLSIHGPTGHGDLSWKKH